MVLNSQNIDLFLRSLCPCQCAVLDHMCILGSDAFRNQKHEHTAVQLLAHCRRKSAASVSRLFFAASGLHQ